MNTNINDVEKFDAETTEAKLPERGNQTSKEQQVSPKLSAMARILLKRNETKHIAQVQEEVTTFEYNKENFFTDDSPKGLISAFDFHKLFSNELMRFEILGVNLFLEHISNRTKLSIPPITKPWHHTKREYYNVWPESRTVDSKFSLVKLPFTEKLVMYYTFDMAKFNLSFDELYDYAESKISL